MNFLRSLFGNKQETEEERKQEQEAHDFDVLKYDGIKALRMQQFDHAERCFRHALQLQEDLESRDYLSQVLIAKGDLEEAMEQLLVMSEAQPDNVRLLIRMADVAFMREDYMQMEYFCRHAAAADDTNPQPMLMLAHALNGQSKWEEAVEALNKATELQADYGDAYLLRGNIRMENGALAEAEEDVAWLQEHAQESEEIWMLKGKLESKKGNHTAAAEAFSKVIDLNPFNSSAYACRGAERLACGDEEGAKEDLDAVAEMAPQDIDNVMGNTPENLEQKVRQAYRDNNPFGLG